MQSRRPLNVVRASEGKPFFELFDPQVALCRETFEVAPDVMVFPCAKVKQVLPAPSVLPREAWQRVIDGKCLVVFDATTDGNVHTPDGSGRLHDFLAEAGVPPDRAVYMTQDRGWGDAYRQHCARYELPPMRVAYYDYFLRSFFKDFEANGDEVYQERIVLFRERAARRSKKYICLNLSPRPAKTLLLAKLMKEGLFDDGYISYGGFDPAKNSRAMTIKVLLQLMAEMRGFAPIVAELMPQIGELRRYEPMFLGEPKRVEGLPTHVKKQASDRQFDEYGDSWFTIVTETEMHSSRISEKPLKSLVNFHPSILLGNRGAVAFTRELGFQSFDGYVDEAYDDEPDDARRFQMVVEEVLRLCALPQLALWKLEQAWAETLTFNARWGLKKLPAIYREVRDVKVVEELTGMFELEDPHGLQAAIRAAAEAAAAAA